MLKIREHSKKSRRYIRAKKAISFISIVFTAAVLLLNFEAAGRGVLEGLSVAARSVIPSLFLFSVLSSFAVDSGTVTAVGERLSPLTRAVFGLSGEEAAVLFTSLFSGFTVGAVMTDRMYISGKVSRETAERILMYSVNAGPPFVIFCVGEKMLGSRSDGVRLYLALTVSTLAVAVFCGRVLKKKETKVRGENAASKWQRTVLKDEVEPPIILTDAFVDAVNSAGNAMLKMTFFISFFGGLGEVLRSLSLPFSEYVGGALEVTVGVASFGRGRLQWVAFFLGFSGVSVIFQVTNISKSFRPSFARIFASRVACGLISAAAVGAFELVFPRTLETGTTLSAASANTVFGGLSGGVAATLALWFFAVTLFSALTEGKRKSAHKIGLHNII